MSNDPHYQPSALPGATGISLASSPVQPSSVSPVGPLHRVFDVLFRFKYRSILFFLLGMTAVVLALIYWPREYTSEAKLFVRVGRGANVTIDPTVTKGLTATVNPARVSEINSALELLTSRADFIYYSFVTMTTLGYGDITPLKSLARSLSIFFSVAGQLYLAFIIATLVGKYLGGGEKPHAKNTDPGE